MGYYTCEVCGTQLKQLMVHTCVERGGELCGPFFEEREHFVGDVRHHWNQLHNCIDPEPDRCYLTCGAEPPAMPRLPRCCRS